MRKFQNGDKVYYSRFSKEDKDSKIYKVIDYIESFDLIDVKKEKYNIPACECYNLRKFEGAFYKVLEKTIFNTYSAWWFFEQHLELSTKN
jgi:hypothetical protein